MLAWHIIFKFALNPKSTFLFVHQVALKRLFYLHFEIVMDSGQ